MFIVFNNLTLVSDYPGMLLKFAPCNLLSQLDIIESETLPTLRGVILGNFTWNLSQSPKTS